MIVIFKLLKGNQLRFVLSGSRRQEKNRWVGDGGRQMIVPAEREGFPMVRTNYNGLPGGTLSSNHRGVWLWSEDLSAGLLYPSFHVGLKKMSPNSKGNDAK